MSIAPAIVKHYPDLSGAQSEVVGHLDGPFLVIAVAPKVVSRTGERV